MSNWGEIISWSCKSLSVPFVNVKAALDTTGLDPAALRARLPRHAFSRACRKLAKARVIRVLAENEASIQFQFTKEKKSTHRFDYDLEAILALDKTTGILSTEREEDKDLLSLAQTELDSAMANCTGNDITRLLQRLFAVNSGLFGVRDAGGAYFVPYAHSGFLEKIEAFIVAVGGKLSRFPVQIGTPSGDKSVKETVTHGMEALIDAHRSAIKEIREDAHPDVFKRLAEKVKHTKMKLLGYGEYLDSQKAKLEESLAEAQEELKERLATAETLRAAKKEAKKKGGKPEEAPVAVAS